MLCKCYLREGIVYVPTLGQVENAHMRHVEPFSVVPLSQVADLRRAFQEAIARGNPIVPSLPLHNRPPPLILKYAGVRSWSAFERSTLSWYLGERDGVYEITPLRRRPDRGWEEDRDNTITLPPGSDRDDAIDRMIAILQAHADA